MGTDLFQSVGDALGGARELYGTGVGQVLTLAADRSLDQLAKKGAAIANDQQTNAKGNQRTPIS